MKSVEFLTSAGMYRPGEFAGFPDALAEQIVKSGAAQFDTRKTNRLGEKLVDGAKAVEEPPVDKMVKGAAVEEPPVDKMVKGAATK